MLPVKLYFQGPFQYLRQGKGRKGNGVGAKAFCRSLPFYFLRDASSQGLDRTVTTVWEARKLGLL